MKRIFTILVCLICFAGVGARAAYALNVQSATPNIGFTGTFNLFGAETLKKNHFSAGFVLDYTRKPLEIHNFTTGASVRGIVNYLVTTDIVGEYGIIDKLTVGLDVPLQLSKHILLSDMTTQETKFGVGDVTAYAKYAFLQQDKYPVGLAIMPFVIVPSGRSNNFVGDAGVDVGAKIILDRNFGGGFIDLNVGFKGRTKTDHVVLTGSTSTLNVGNELIYGLGGGVDIVGKKLEFIAEMISSATIDNFADKQTTPIQFNGGLRSTLMDKQLSLYLGAGGGLKASYGSPQFRIFTGLAYHFPRETKERVAEKVAVQEKMVSMILEGVLFDFDKSNIKTSAIPKLERNITKLETMQFNRINVIGYTDSKGTEEYNQSLSERRAQAVKDYLVDRGIASDRITVSGLGESGAVAPNKTLSGNDYPEGRAKNRRAIELQIWTQ